MAFLVVLDSMTPAERVAFVLHDVFRYPFADVARVLGRSQEACRQLATSARRRIDSAQIPAAPGGDNARVLACFKRAWDARDVRALVKLLDPNAVALADGGGLADAALTPVKGADAIAEGLVNVVNISGELELLERVVNGQPGLVTRDGGFTDTVIAFDVDGERIRRIWIVRNPQKLRSWTGEVSTTS
jgi:RNA polymerase sigma-70 factor (ECF subfamily)